MEAAYMALGLVFPHSGLELKATLVSVEKTRVDASIRLVPGVAAALALLAIIEADGDGAITGAEQKAYAHRVLSDLLLRWMGNN